MENFKIERTSGTNLEFKGELLAWVYSDKKEEDGRIRWTELSVYKTETGKWVYHTTGKALTSGFEENEPENFRSDAFVLEKPADILQYVRLPARVGGGTFISILAKQLLNFLSVNHPEFRGIETEKI